MSTGSEWHDGDCNGQMMQLNTEQDRGPLQTERQTVQGMWNMGV